MTATGLAGPFATVRPLTAAWVFAGRIVTRFFRSRVNLIGTLLFPVVLMFVQLALSSRMVKSYTDVPYVAILAPNVMLWILTSASSSAAMGIVNEVQKGMLDRIRTMPVATRSLLAGRILGDLIRCMLLALIVVAIAFAGGFRFRAGVLPAVAFFGVVALFAVLCVSIGVTAGLFAQNAEVVRLVVSNPALLLFLLSSGFVPLTAFPGALQPVVRVNPLSIADRALLGLSYGGPVATPFLETFAWAAGVSVPALMIAAVRFRRMEVAPRRIDG